MTKTCNQCHRALEATLEFFFFHKTGKYGLRAVCIVCYLEKIRESRNSDRYRKYQREYKRKYTQTAHGQVSTRRLSYLARYGITIEDYSQLLGSQGGGCAICGTTPTNKRLAVDHCHNTGKIRGLLCMTCNMQLGRYHAGYRFSKNYQEAFENYLELPEHNVFVGV